MSSTQSKGDVPARSVPSAEDVLAAFSNASTPQQSSIATSDALADIGELVAGRLNINRFDRNVAAQIKSQTIYSRAYLRAITEITIVMSVAMHPATEHLP